MTFIIVSKCPKCGAPIYGPDTCSEFDDVPEVKFTCSCRIPPASTTIPWPKVNEPYRAESLCPWERQPARWPDTTPYYTYPPNYYFTC